MWKSKADGCRKQILSVRDLIAPIDVPRLIAALKLLEFQLLCNPRAPAEAFGLRKFIELFNEGSCMRAPASMSSAHLNWLEDSPMVEAVIFDIDGTLVDSVDLHASAWVEAFQQFGHQVLFEDARRQIGKGGDKLLPVFLSKQEIDDSARNWRSSEAKSLRNAICRVSLPSPRSGH